MPQWCHQGDLKDKRRWSGVKHTTQVDCGEWRSSQGETAPTALTVLKWSLAAPKADVSLVCRRASGPGWSLLGLRSAVRGGSTRLGQGATSEAAGVHLDDRRYHTEAIRSKEKTSWAHQAVSISIALAGYEWWWMRAGAAAGHELLFLIHSLQSHSLSNSKLAMKELTHDTTGTQSCSPPVDVLWWNSQLDGT